MTIRQNILHNSPYDQEKYFRVLHACCLLEDLISFPTGDRTVIGQKGINLSGGQKSRVGLARAVYADHDISLLDDVFAALDSIVGKKVFDRVLCGLLKNKTRILVTHKEEIIRHGEVDQILTLEDGTLEVHRVSHPLMVDKRVKTGIRTVDGDTRGSSTSILSVDYEISSEDYQLLHDIVCTVPSNPTSAHLPKLLVQGHGGEEAEEGTRNHSYDARPRHSLSDLYTNTQEEDQHISLFATAEEKESGSVSARVYSEYARAAGGYHVIALLVIVQTIWQLLGIGSDVFITYWANEDPQEQQDRLSWNIAIYALLAIGSGFVVLIRTLTIAYYGYHAGKTLFNWMLQSLLYAPMWWMDKNPSGR
jgi:ABC-type bacteriocin/lantibiotic exporter with double-glycine peptidase domain